jgi:glycosyltransferase involved in cell wall biosynthesis
VKVAIDIRQMTDYGVATYTRNIVRNLGRMDRANDYFLIGAVERLQDVGELPPNFHCVPFAASDGIMGGYFEFRRAVRSCQCDVVHFPQMFWRPRPTGCPYIVTVHDLLDYLYRNHAHSNLARGLRFHLTRRVLLGAARIFAVSNFTKHDLTRLFDVPPAKVEVIYNALDDRFLLGHATQADRDMIAERYQVNYPFILYAGRVSPHKNIVRIIEAFSALKSELAKGELFPDLKLVIIGDQLSKHPDLRRAVIKSAVQFDVRFLGFVPIEVLRIFYDLAKIFVFPSLYEGFGLPPLEAMAHDTPVVASNVTAVPEVLGNAAVLVNPENVFEISRALYRVLLDRPLRQRMKDAGRERIRRYSWQNSVDRILQAYNAVAGRSAAAASD